MKKGTSPRTDALIAYHYKEETEGFLLKGESKVSIAARLGLSVSQVNEDLRKLNREWEREVARSIARVKGEELQRLRMLEADAYAAWERSMQPKTRTRRETSSER